MRDTFLPYMRPKIVAIIQARIGSTRLPAKVLMDIDGQTMLERVVGRVKATTSLDDIVVATTTSKRDEAIAKLCAEKSWSCYRGSEDDVLDRYYRAALSYKADIVVRITADCPLIDPQLIDQVVEKFMSLYPDIDYVCNDLLGRTYPRGLDTETISVDALHSEWLSCPDRYREHVTLNLRKNLGDYRTADVCGDKDHSYMRWCVDTAADLEFVRRVYGYFGNREFRWTDVARMLEKEHPEWIITDCQVDPE